jgi:uncharacterized protein YnzC (UPF0291/DUF896 family)
VPQNYKIGLAWENIDDVTAAARYNRDYPLGVIAMDASSPETSGRPRCRQWLQYSLRSLLILVLPFSIASSWFAARMQKARRQQAAVEEWHKGGGWVRYDYEPSDSSQPFMPGSGGQPPYPAWLVKWLGVDFLADVSEVTYIPQSMRAMNCLGKPAPDPPLDLEILEGFQRVKTLSLVIRDPADLAVIGRMTQLEHLNLVDCSAGPLRSNELRTNDLAHLSALRELRSISWNAFHFGPGISQLAELPKLRELTFLFCTFPRRGLLSTTSAPTANGNFLLPVDDSANNNASPNGDAPLAALDQVETLRFEVTELTDLASEWLAKCHNVRTIEFSRAEVSDEAMDVIARLPHLEELTFLNTRPNLRKLTAMANLRRLTLRENYLRDEDLENLANLQQLETLDLTGNDITGEGLKHASALPRLSTLILEYCPITDAGAQEIARFHGLKNLVLPVGDYRFDPSQIQVSEKGVRLIRNAFPNYRGLDGWKPQSPAVLMPQ